MEFTIKDIIAIIRKKLALILLCSILGMAMLGAYTFFFVEPEYTATAKMYVYNKKNDYSNPSFSQSDLTLSKSLVDTYLIIIKSRDVANLAIERLDGRYPDLTAAEIQSIIKGASIDETEAFVVTATTTDPQRSADIVNAVTSVAPEKISEFIGGSTAKVIESALVPTRYNWPVARNAVLGAIIGFVLSFAFALLVTMLDKTIHGYRELAKRSDIPVVGTVPVNEAAIISARKSRRKSRDKAHAYSGTDLLVTDKTPFVVAESYRTARTNIFYLPIEDECKKIAFTSSVPGEGKTINSINVAILLAQVNKRVLVIDADMRSPKIKKYLELEPETGLSEYLAGIVSEPEITRCEKFGVDVITSGKTSTAPAELLDSQRMSMLIKSLESKYDYIIIDTPPVNYVTDATVIAKYINGYILSIRAEYSSFDEFRNATSALKRVEANLFGTMLIGINPKTDSYGGYGYRAYGDNV